MGAAVENDMFPDFVAECDHVIFNAIPSEQRQRLAVIDDARRIERIVEKDDAGARGKGGGEARFRATSGLVVGGAP